jgi:hypothetical protein
MSYTSQPTNTQSLNGIISLTDGVITIENGTISGLDSINLVDLQVSDTATIENLVVNNQIDMTSGKITNLANGTNANDAVNKSQLDLKADTTYVDTNFLNKTTATTQNVNADINMNTKKITGLANGSSSNDAVNKSQLDLKADTTYVDTNFLNKTTSTTQIVNSNLNMNTTNKIINLANGSTSNDAVNKSQLDLKADTTYVDTNFLNKTTATTQIVNSNLDMNTTNKIINLANGSTSNDAVNKSQLDLKSDTTYLDTNFLNKTTGTTQIVNSNLDMNTTNKIINLANGSTSNDAVNKSQLDLKSDTTYLDTNFLNKTTATAQIVNSNLDMNTKRIYNLSNPTTQTDAVNLSYLSTNYLNKTATANQTIANKVLFTNATTDIVSNPVITMVNAVGGASNGNFLRFHKNVVETSNTEIGGLSACDKNIGNTIIRVADLIFSRGSNGEARMDLKMIDGNRNPLRITDGEFTSKNNNYYILKQDGTQLLYYTSSSDAWGMSKDLNMTQNDITNANTLEANFYLKVVDATSGVVTPAIQFQNTTTGSNNGIYMRFYKNFNRLPNTELGGIIFADKNATSQAISRAVQLKASIGSDSTPIFDILFNSDGFNPLRVSNTQNILSNDDFYIKNKTSAQDLFTYLNSTDKFTMYKPLDCADFNSGGNQILGTNSSSSLNVKSSSFFEADVLIESNKHLAFYNSDLTAESGMKMYFDRSAGSLGRFYMDMRGSEIQIRTDPSSEPTSQRVKINNSETTINNNLICNGNVNFNGDVLVNSNNHLMLGGNPATTGGMRLVYDAGFQTYGTSYIDSRATSLKIRLTTISDPTTDRIEINNFATTIKDNLIVDGNTTLGNFATGDTLTCNCQATFPNTSKLTFQSGSILSFDSGAEIHGFRVKLRSIGADHTISSGSDLVYDGILCTNMAGTNIIITMPARSYVWNNRKLLIKSQTGDVKIRQVTTGTNTTTRNNSTNDLDITQNYRVVTYLFDSDFGTNGKIWSLD